MQRSVSRCPRDIQVQLRWQLGNLPSLNQNDFIFATPPRLPWLRFARPWRRCFGLIDEPRASSCSITRSARLIAVPAEGAAGDLADDGGRAVAVGTVRLQT